MCQYGYGPDKSIRVSKVDCESQTVYYVYSGFRRVFAIDWLREFAPEDFSEIFPDGMISALVV